MINRKYEEAFALIIEGKKYAEKGIGFRAMRCYRASLRVFPTPEAHFRLGEEYFTRYSYTKAAKQFLIAMELDPYFTLPVYGMASVYFAVMRFETAIEWFEKAITMGDDNLKALCYFGIGQVHEEKGDSVKALDYYYKSHILMPEDSKTLDAIVYISACRN